MGLLLSWFSLAFMPGLVWSAHSGISEVDLIFPRNESFAPSPLTPIVFAVQNPGLLSTFKPILSWSIDQWDADIKADDYIKTGDLVHLSERNLTNVTDPYFFSWGISHLNVEGTFSFSWQLALFNCSHDTESDTTKEQLFGSQRTQFFFTTKNGTSLPDLAAFSEKEACNRTLGQAMHVPSALELPPTQTADWGGPSCAVNPDLSPNPSPCNAQMDASAAASISASLSAAACGNPLRTGISCPTPSSENAASTSRLPVTVAWMLAVGTWLAYSLA